MIKSIGFIGCGNMAGAIIKGAYEADCLTNYDVKIFDIDRNKAQRFSENGAEAVGDIEEIARKCDCVVLAVKPGVFPTILPSIKDMLKTKNPLIISIAAGKTTAYITELLGYDAAVVRVMPNINALAGAAMSAYCSRNELSEEHQALVEGLFDAVGRIIPVPEDMFPLFSAIAGCAPAFAYMFIDAMARAAVKHGMNKAQALEISAQTVLGSAKLILESGEHPWALIDRVCSPGGTTIEGIAALQDCGLDSAVRKAVEAALDKDSKV